MPQLDEDHVENSGAIRGPACCAASALRAALGGAIGSRRATPLIKGVRRREQADHHECLVGRSRRRNRDARARWASVRRRRTSASSDCLWPALAHDGGPAARRLVQHRDRRRRARRRRQRVEVAASSAPGSARAPARTGLQQSRRARAGLASTPTGTCQPRSHRPSRTPRRPGAAGQPRHQSRADPPWADGRTSTGRPGREVSDCACCSTEDGSAATCRVDSRRRPRRR